MPDANRQAVLQRSFFCSVVLLFTVALTQTASADVEIPDNWCLKPSRVTAGDSFRLLIVTYSGLAPGDSPMSRYDGFVSWDLNSGHAAIRAYRADFKALVSTADVDARDHTATTGTGVPIYWLGGSKVADNYGDLYDGDWDNPNPGKDRSGNDVAFGFSTRIWTGSKADGTEARVNGVSKALGSDTVWVGLPGWSDPQPLSGPVSTSIYANDQIFPLYGLSPVFLVSQNSFTIELSAEPSEVTESSDGREVTVTATLNDETCHTQATVVTVAVGSGTAVSGTDFEAVQDFQINIPSGDHSAAATFTLTPMQDSIDEEDETVSVTGTATGMTVAGTEVIILDDDVPAVTASFGEATYTVAEGSSVSVKVTLSADPERSVTIPITKANQGGATDADYSGVPTSVIFASGETEKTMGFSATQDTVDDDGESVKLAFGTLPDGVSAGSPTTTTITITDDDVPAVTASFGEATYTVAEGSSVSVKVTLSADPERSVTIPITKANQGGATDADYSGVPTSVIFASGETEKTMGFSATQDTVDDDGESVKLAFGTLPDGVSAGTTPEATVVITDDDVPAVTASFGEATYTVAEGSSVSVKVTLSADPERSVTIPITKANQGGATDADYSGVPTSVIFASGEMEKTMGFSATQDTVDDDGESVKLAFGTLPDGVSAGTTPEATVVITDDDVPAVTASFGEATYTVAEGSSVSVKVTLSADPERSVTIPITKANQGGATDADYSGVPTSVIFASGEMEKTMGFSATQDTVDDDGESVKLAFGTLPDGVSAGTTPEATVVITDDDVPAVTASFGEAAYTVAEGSSVSVKVTLSADLERSVTIPITKANQGGATDADYSGVPTSVIFASGETEKTMGFSATQDTVDDDGESVKLAFGTLPDGVSAGTTPEATVVITDDDVPAVTASFGEATYTVAEGSSVSLKVTLSADPKRSVTIPITKANQGGATDADYSGVPTSVIFASGEMEKTMGFSATQDTVDDDGESVKLAFGTLPDGVSAGTTPEATVVITDDDDPAVTVSYGSSLYTATEGGTAATVTVTLSANPERQVVVPITATNHGGATNGDYSGIPASVTFERGDTSRRFTVTATDDSIDDDGESVTLGFATLPDGVTAGRPLTTPVTIEDNDAAPEITVSDARAMESSGEIMFEARMSRASNRPVTLRCVTADGTAKVDKDYSGTRAILTFPPGETTRTITVSVLDDTLDEDNEMFTVLLSDARNATLIDGAATGMIIDNDQSVAKAWLARFARTVTSHMLDAVGGRLTQAFQPGLHVTIGGQPVNLNDTRSSAGSNFDAGSARPEDRLRREWNDSRIPPRSLSLNELLLGSSFSWAALADGRNGSAARWTAWARGAATRFTGAEGDVSLDGNVTTGTVGADYEWGWLLAGVAVSHSVGNGGFDLRGAVHRPGSEDELESSLTSVQPYLRYQMNERLVAWALLGYGQGDLALTQENTPMTTDIEMRMGIAGVRGALLSAAATGGFDLAVRSDVFLTRIQSDAATDLPSAEADVSRLRLILEGSHTRTLASGGVLTPSLQIGLRYDDGDAETGTGLELGTGLRYTDPTRGLIVEVSGRGLLAHEARAYEEWGVGGSVRLDPGPSGLGPSLTFTTSFGETSSGVEALWARETMAGLAANGGQAPGGRLDIELGYRLAVFSGRGVGTPYAKGSFSESGNSFLLGYELGLGQSVTLSVEGMRREPVNAVPESEGLLRATLRW